MNKDIFKGKWKEMQAQVKTQWNKLTDGDVNEIEGSYDELLGRLQKAYGYKKEEAEHAITQFLKKLGW